MSASVTLSSILGSAPSVSFLSGASLLMADPISGLVKSAFSLIPWQSASVDDVDTFTHTAWARLQYDAKGLPIPEMYGSFILMLEYDSSAGLQIILHRSTSPALYLRWRGDNTWDSWHVIRSVPL